MADTQITVHLDTDEKTRIWQAATAAGIPVSQWMMRAARDRLVADAADTYHRFVAATPDYRHDLDLARRRAAATARRRGPAAGQGAAA